MRSVRAMASSMAGAVTVSRSRRWRIPATSVRRPATSRSASSRAALTASSRSLRALRRSSSAARMDSVARDSATRARSTATGDLALLLADRRERRLERLLVLREPAARVGDDRLGQAEPLGDRERLAAAREADRQAVGRRQRLEVELDRGVARRGGLVRVDLDLGVVRGRRHEGARADEVVEQRLRERRALRRVGAGAELVEQHEGPGAGVLDDPDDRAQVARERREATGRWTARRRCPRTRRAAPAAASPSPRARGARPGASGTAGPAFAARPSCRRCSGR